MTTQPLSDRPDATNPTAYSPDHATLPATPAPVSRDTVAAAMDRAKVTTTGVSSRPKTAPASLRGKTYPIVLARIEQYTRDDGTPYWRTVGDDTETVQLSLDNNDVADIEDQWGTIDGWSEAMNTKPAKTIRDTLAIALHRDPLEVGVAMLTDQRSDYVAKLGLAFSIANGVDPTQLEDAYRLMDEGVEQNEAYRQAGLEPPPTAR